jgi:hypothetical protein
VDVVDLRPHQPTEDPAAPVRRHDGDQRHPGGTDQAARHTGLVREDACAADDLAVLERRVDAVRGDDGPEPLRELLAGGPSEVVHDRPHHLGELLRPGGPDLDAQTRSKGA